MNKNLEHVLHAGILVVVLCFIMKQMGQTDDQACSRSIVIGSVALIYMVMFGHTFPPGNLNPALKF